jgi:hypothetical protein
MATLEEVIRQRLAEATTQVEEAKKVSLKNVEPEEVGDEVDTTPSMKKKSLCKEDLDAMTQLEFDSIDEEQLDELSKTTLGNYLKSMTESMPKWAVDKYNKNLEDKMDKQFHPDYNRKMSDAEFQEKLMNKAKERKLKLKEDTVSSQVSALLEAEGLSEDFKEQAVTIFEAAVTDRVLQLEEELKQEFDSQLAEAKEELDKDIDGFLSEAIQQWKQDNEVAIKSNFKSQLAESFMDGMRALIAEHNIEVPEDKEDALEVALGEVDKLKESIVSHVDELAALQEQVNEMKAEKILESFKEKMTMTEFDRFVQLSESIKFKDESQYAKQLTIVLENFSVDKQKPTKVEPIVEVVTEAVQKVVTESNSDMNVYTAYINKKR